jgi:hypothetical protein
MKKQQRKEAENDSESDSDGENYIVAKNTKKNTKYSKFLLFY